MFKTIRKKVIDTEQVIMKKPRKILVSEVETTTNGTEKKNIFKRNFPYIKEYLNVRIKRLRTSQSSVTKQTTI